VSTHKSGLKHKPIATFDRESTHFDDWVEMNSNKRCCKISIKWEAFIMHR